MPGYSQLGQDRFVLELLGHVRQGFFLDSGAADGVHASNTYLLERAYGWRGICVEPNSLLFRALVQNRSAHCVNCCLYDREAEVEFIEAGMLGGVVQDFHPTLLAHAARVGALPRDARGNPSSVLKPTRTVTSVLAQFSAPPIIDYWSLDTEGSELRILRSFPFDRYRVRVLTVEHNRYPMRAAIRRFLEACGYVLIRDFDIDDCYVEARPTSLGSRRRWSRRLCR